MTLLFFLFEVFVISLSGVVFNLLEDCVDNLDIIPVYDRALGHVGYPDRRLGERLSPQKLGAAHRASPMLKHKPLRLPTCLFLQFTPCPTLENMGRGQCEQRLSPILSRRNRGKVYTGWHPTRPRA